MKTIAAIIIFFTIFACSNNATENNVTNENVAEYSDKNINDSADKIVSESAIKAGSRKEMLLGDWQANDDPELMIRISPEKYCTFINGQQNWDNPWDLCNYIEYAPENEDDNGDYVLVHLADKSSVFYGQEIIALTENQLEVMIVKSNAGSGMVQSFTRK